MEKEKNPYRWVVLAALMAVTVVIELQWLAHAAIARAAEAFYAGQFDRNSFFNVDFLALSYMFVYLIVSLPASYAIDRWGIRRGIGFGCLLTAVFGLMKGLGGADFTLVIIAQIGLAAAQPFILNGVTAMAADWFPLKERGTAAGLASLAQYLGIIAAMGITPLLVVNSPADPAYGQGIPAMLRLYGIISAVTALAALFLIRDGRRVGREKRDSFHFTEGFKIIFARRDMILTLALFLIGLGIFNAVSSLVDSIAGYLGVSDSDGMIGVLMIGGGIIGALVLPILSDKMEKRKPFLVLCMGGMVPALAGLAFAGYLFESPQAVYQTALVCAFFLGFFVMSAGPIGFQYAAEVSYPAPESSSQGLLLLAGQISGMVFTALMSGQDNRWLGPVMVVFSVLSLLSLTLVLMIGESPLILTGNAEAGSPPDKPIGE